MRVMCQRVRRPSGMEADRGSGPAVGPRLGRFVGRRGEGFGLSDDTEGRSLG